MPPFVGTPFSQNLDALFLLAYRARVPHDEIVLRTKEVLLAAVMAGAVEGQSEESNEVFDVLRGEVSASIEKAQLALKSVPNATPL
jgi:hypothetical protein